ncbi:unnamed protein product [Rotaria socialis]|uniref:G-protein coupled receptors family 1 profile domain-containing protein n=1 Tax=Rotaria socialis TaxID=392032 RepID=A0A818CBM8_9BILA|nr:unnamed protein product [Rotaria socialis]CAF3188446.1 unnamed protein product [Rotaria socialis]CAF3425916.1 unnamed protein product [Rotaria socialis]CAF3642469.1 unnamed protein product [Rotaria socialis]CAF3670002.1 unnamed protein product [Rotaria socialis]
MEESISAASRIILAVVRPLLIYSSYICLICGLIGNMLNIMIFGFLKVFRGNPSSFYLIVESFANCGVLLNVYVLRILSSQFNIDLTRNSIILCKIRTVELEITVMVSLTTICCEALDQYLVTSHDIACRQSSTLKLAQRMTLINVVAWILHSIPFAIFYEILPSTGCDIANKYFSLYFCIVYLSLLNGLVPLVVSLVFSAFAYRNVRRIIRRQVSHIRRRLDRQMTAIVFSRVVLLVSVSIPFGAYLLYSINAPPVTGNALLSAIDQLCSAVTSTLFYMNYAVSDYIVHAISIH